MPNIRIENIGPINDTGVLDLARLTIFIGQQSTGKSTIMKIFCFCCWVEKYCIAHGNVKWFGSYQHFYKTLKSFHHFPDNFFTAGRSSIEYQGEFLHIKFRYSGRKTNAEIIPFPNFTEAYNTKLCFIPSERNLISSVKNVDATYRVKSIDNIFNYLMEWDSVKRHYNKDHYLKLTFLHGMEFYYDSKNSREVIRLSPEKEITPYYASSGVQSSYSLYVMLDYLTHRVFDQNASFSRKDINSLIFDLLKEEKITADRPFDEIREQLGSRLAHRLQYKASRIFIEEPEQNLYPTAQADLIRNIVRMINTASDRTGNETKVCITTHSPYIVSVINVLIQGYEAMRKDKGGALQILPEEELLSFDQVKCYYVDEKGTVEPLMRKDKDVSMMDAAILDGVSDQLDDWMYRFNLILSKNDGYDA